MKNIIIFANESDMDMMGVQIMRAFGYLDENYQPYPEFQTRLLLLGHEHPSDGRWYVPLYDVAGTKYADPRYAKKMNSWQDVVSDFLSQEQIENLKDEQYLIDEGFIDEND
jgi:hypothetical protein